MRSSFSLLFGLLLAATLSFAQQQVAFTFDDLPAHSALPPGVTREDVAKQIIKALQDAHAPTVYGFVNAVKLQDVPQDVEVLKLWRAAGFPLGNHSYTHMDLNRNSPEDFEHDIELNEPTLQSLMQGEDWKWFRYPYLSEGETVEKRRAARLYLSSHGYHVAQVSLDFSDYAWNAPYTRCMAKKDEKAIEQLKTSYLNNAAEYISHGEKMAKIVYGRKIKHVLLMHIGAFDAVMLPQLIQLFKQKGFKFITLQEAESDPAYQSDPDIGLKVGIPLTNQMMKARHLEEPPHKQTPFKELDSMCR